MKTIPKKINSIQDGSRSHTIENKINEIIDYLTSEEQPLDIEVLLNEFFNLKEQLLEALWRDDKESYRKLLNRKSQIIELIKSNLK